MAMRRSLLPLLVVLSLSLLASQMPRKIGEAGESFRYAAASPDGRYCAGLRYDTKWSYGVWSLEQGEVLVPWTDLPDGPATNTPFAWSPDSSTLVVGSGNLVLVHEKGFGKVRKLKADWKVRDLRYSGSTLMVRADHSVMLFQMPKGKMFYRQGQQRLLAARLSRDERTLALASFEEPILLFDVRDKKALGTLPAGPATIGLEFCNDDKWLACGFRFRDQRRRDMALVYDWRARARVGGEMVQPYIMGFAVADDGSRLLARGPDATRVWQVESQQLLCQRAVSSRIMDALSPDGKLVLTAPADTARVVGWSPETEQDQFQLELASLPTGLGFPAGDRFSVTANSLSLYQLP